MKTIKKSVLVLFVLTFLASCSKDDEQEMLTLSANNFVLNLDENPEANKSLGKVQASNASGNLSFVITSQQPSGALSINSSTGELTVVNASLFDFEQNPTITAQVTITDSQSSTESSVSINLNDLDDILFFLSDSKSKYQNAASGDWIEVTEAEYNALALNLNQISKVGTTDTEYSANKVNDAVGPYTRANHTTTAKIPKNSYVFAFKYKVIDANNVSGVKIKQSSTANNSGFKDLGKALPSHSGSLKDVFFVLKGNNTSVTNDGYLGLFQPVLNNYKVSLFNSTSNNGAYYGNGDNSATPGQWSSWLVHYQGLSTTQKQW